MNMHREMDKLVYMEREIKKLYIPKYKYRWKERYLVSQELQLSGKLKLLVFAFSNDLPCNISP